MRAWALLFALAPASLAGEWALAPPAGIAHDLRIVVSSSVDARDRRGGMEWKLSATLYRIADESDGRILLAMTVLAPRDCCVGSGVVLFRYDPASGSRELWPGDPSLTGSGLVEDLLPLVPIPSAGAARIAARAPFEDVQKRRLFGLERELARKGTFDGPDGEGRTTLRLSLAAPFEEPFADPARALLEWVEETVVATDAAGSADLFRREKWRERDGSWRIETVSTQLRNRRALGAAERQALEDLPALYEASKTIPGVGWASLDKARAFVTSRPADHPFRLLAERLADRALPPILPEERRLWPGLAGEEGGYPILGGGRFDPEECEGKVTLLALWAPGSGPANWLARHLRSASKELRAMGVEVVVLHCAEEEGQLPDPARLGALEGQRIVLGGDPVRLYSGVSALPALLWLDREGRIAAKQTGGDPGDGSTWWWLGRRLLEEK